MSVLTTPMATDGAITGPASAHPRVRGQFTAGNPGPVTHGGRRRVPVLHPEDSELYAAYSTDLGDDLTTAQRVALRRLVEVDAVITGSVSYLRRSRESLTNKRVLAAIDVFLNATTQQMRILQLLGLKRQQKHVNPMDALRRAVDDANQPRTSGGERAPMA